MKVTKPILLDSTGQEIVSKLSDLKDVLDNKMFTPPVLLDNKSITENGVYRASTEDAVDGYAKVTVNVAGGGGGLDFTSVMLRQFPSASVPENWEIPVDVTNIIGKEGYYYRDELLDIPMGYPPVKSITLATGHTGIEYIGGQCFQGWNELESIDFANGAIISDEAFQGCAIEEIGSGFSCTLQGKSVFGGNLHLESADTTNFVVGTDYCESTFDGCENLTSVTGILTYNDGNKNRLLAGVYRGTALTSLDTSSSTEVDFMHSNCLAELKSNSFSSTALTNAKYKIDETTVPIPANEKIICRYNWWGSVGWHPITTPTTPHDMMDQGPATFDTSPVLHNLDGSSYSRDMTHPYDEYYAIDWVDGENVYYVRYYGLAERAEQMNDLWGDTAWSSYWSWSIPDVPPFDGCKCMCSVDVFGGGDSVELYFKDDPIIDAGSGQITGRFSNRVTIYDKDGNEYSGTGTKTMVCVERWGVEEEQTRPLYTIYNKYYDDPFNPSDTSPIIDTAVIGVAQTVSDNDSEQFKGCECSTFNLPNLVKVCESMFAECRNVVTLSLPSVTRVGHHALRDMNALTTLRLPKCEYLGECIWGDDMQGNVPLTDLYLNEVTAVTKVKYNTFGMYGGGINVTVHVPSTLVDQFKADGDWANLETEGYVTIVGV